jgi:hypothetical protein
VRPNVQICEPPRKILQFLFNEDQLVEGGTSTPVTVFAFKLCLYLNNDSSDWKNLMFAALKVEEWYLAVLFKVTSHG